MHSITEGMSVKNETVCEPYIIHTGTIGVGQKAVITLWHKWQSSTTPWHTLPASQFGSVYRRLVINHWQYHDQDLINITISFTLLMSLLLFIIT